MSEPVKNYRLRVSRRSFDSYTEEFTRVIVDGDAAESCRRQPHCRSADAWATVVTDLVAHLTACREYNDSMLGPRGRCDTILNMLDDSAAPAFSYTRPSIAFTDLTAFLAEGGPRPLSLSMGSSHHNAPQWSIQCALEDPATAVTVTAVRVLTGWAENYKVTEHCANIREAVDFLAQNYDPDGRKVSVAGAEPTELLSPFAFLDYKYGGSSANPYAFFDTAALPLRLEFTEGAATVTVEITRT